VGLVDVLPTVLAHIGLPPPADYDLPGRDIAPQAPSGVAAGAPVFGEVSRWDGNNLDLVAVIDEDGYKRVVDLSVLPRETAAVQSLGLWDTKADGKEARNLVADMPVRAAYGEQLIAHWLHRERRRRDSLQVAPPPTAEITDELRQDLRALGYLR
jgi:arylsulfatase A-like enzyme